MSERPAITTLLCAISQGDGSAQSQLYALVYDELKRIARGVIRSASGAMTMKTSTLVHEAYLKIAGSQEQALNDALIADLEAFLDGRPVQARHGGNWYHLSRFVARHRVAVAISLSAAIALVALTALALLQTQRARLDAERARLSAEFMESVLKAADPLTSKKAIQTALDLMDAANENMQSKFGICRS